MNKKNVFLLVLLLICNLTILAQNNFILEKDHEISRKAKKGYLGAVEEKENGSFDMVYFLKSSARKVKIETYSFDKDCNLLNTTNEDWDVEKVSKRYKTFKYKGDIVLTTNVSVSASLTSKLIFKKRKVTARWNWWRGGYIRNVKMLDKIKFTDEEGSKYLFFGGAYEVERDSNILVMANNAKGNGTNFHDYDLIKVDNTGKMEVIKKFNFANGMQPLFSKPLTDEQSDYIENDDMPRDWILVMAPCKVGNNGNPNNEFLYLRITPEGTIKENFTFNAPMAGWRILEAYEKDSKVVMYGIGVDKSSKYFDQILTKTVASNSASAEEKAETSSATAKSVLGGFGGLKKIADLASGKEDLQPTQDVIDGTLDEKKYTDFIITQIANGAVTYTTITSNDEINQKAIAGADMKKPLTFDGNKFKVQGLDVLHDNSLAISLQDFKKIKSHNDKMFGTQTAKASDVIYKGMYLLHFDAAGKLLHNFTVEIDQKNKKGFFNNSPLTADMYQTKSSVYETADGKNVNWIMSIVKAIDKSSDSDTNYNFDGSSSTTVTTTWEPLYSIEYGKLDLVNGKSSEFKTLGADEKRKYYLYDGLNRIKIGDFIYFFSETTRGDKLLLSRLKLDE